MATSTTTTHVVILPSPGMGHLIPLVQFTKTLSLRHRISATILLPTDCPLSVVQKALLSAVDHRLLPTVNLDDSDAVMIETRISLTIARSLPSIRAAVKALLDDDGKHIAAFVVDLFGTDAFEVALEFEIPSYIFFPSTAMALSLFLHLPELDKTVSCEYGELSEKLRIPGCVPVQGKDLLDPVQDRTNDAYKWTLHHAKRYRIAEGIIVNSFLELEPGPVKALQEKLHGKPVVYPIGPLIQSGEDSEPCACSEWLDRQPDRSVLYVSFGSGGTLCHDQITELALGLEMSERRFLWVLRCPSGATSNASYFGIQNCRDPLAYLPEGFVEKTGARGLVVPLWAPQVRILAHKSISAFLTHCGWNSTLESVVNGVPLIAWPLYAEQRMNAVILHEDAKVAMRVEKGGNGLVGRVEISNVVKRLVGGEEGIGIPNRILELKLDDDEGLVEGEEGKGIQSRNMDLKNVEDPTEREEFIGIQSQNMDLEDVDCLMEGKQVIGIQSRNMDLKDVEGPMEEALGIRSRIIDLKHAAARVLGENGSSTKSLGELVSKWGSAGEEH